MIVIICATYKNNPFRIVDVTERTRFSMSRLNDLEDIGQGQRSSHATHPLMLLIICTKYGKNPSWTVDATGRTRKVNRQTDGQYVVQPNQCKNQLSSWYGKTFRKKSEKLFRGRNLILMKLKPHVSLAGSSTYSPFRVFLSTRGPKIAQAWQKSVGVKTLTIWECVPNLRPLYDF